MKKVIISAFIMLLVITAALAGILLQSPGQTSADPVPGVVIGIAGNSNINQCEINTYTISVQNNTGSDMSNLVVVAKLQNLTGFSYIAGSASLDINGGAAFCTSDPAISGGYSGNCAPAPAAPYLTWDVNSLCGATTLSNGETLNITFDLETNCDAVSGSLNLLVDFDLSGSPECDDTGVLNIQVNPGAVTIKKTPNVIPQVLGQDVTWTLTVENTGFGVIENVEVTDVLGAGLAYVSSVPAGINAGGTTTWTSTEFPALASMDPGDIETIDITATVIACNNLVNAADVRFGCDPSPNNTCFNTATDGGTARASVQRIVRSPLLQFTPPDISFTYCDDAENVSFTITNIGDGIAYDVYTIVDFGSLGVSNVSAGAIYNVADTRFELAAPLNPGSSYDLSFDLNFTDWCGSFPSGDLLWQKLYKDECDQEFYPPVELSTINPPAASPGVSVSKAGAGATIQIGDSVTYNVTSSYNGPVNCGTGTTSDITVVDTVPDGFTVTDAGGGVWVPGGGGTGGTITWIYTPPASLNTSVTFQSPSANDCETYCFTTFTNSITASGTDCCGCPLNAAASETTAIECEELVDSEKTAVPSTGIRCDTIQYTNTYVFEDNPVLDSVDISQLVFTEDADSEQEYVPGSLAVTLSGVGDITACATAGLTDTTPTPGGNLAIDFSACSGNVRNRTLTITYQLTITENTVGACNGTTFYSWSTLDMNLSTGSACLPDGEIHETTVVSVDPPAMSVSITGLSQIMNTCQTQTIDITLTQTSTVADPKDVILDLSGLNYYVVNPAATVCGGVPPVACTPVINGSGNYIWTYGDAFAGGSQSATIQLEVQKRCSGGGDLVATAYFDDNCNDDATPDKMCSVSGIDSPSLLLRGDLLIEKTPETYYASTNQVQWEIYVTNRGAGIAYNVWVDDVLGSGLLYEHGVNPVVVDDMTGVTINDSLDHNGAAINGASVEIDEMAPGERRQITFIARQIDCTNLTNDVTSSWGCIGVDCQTPVSDSSIVNIPAPNLINTNVITPGGGVDACSSPDGFITLRNAGQVSCYNLQVTETLPPGLLYVSGSTRWRLNGGGWNGPNIAYDPNPATSPLVWTSTEIPALASTDPGDTIEIEFGMISDCPFAGGDVTCSTQYENPCADVFNTTDSIFSAAFNAPEISITKTADKTILDCGDTVTWTIEVTNNSLYIIPIIWVEDTLGDFYTYNSSLGDPPYTSDNGTNVGQLVTWELQNVGPGDTVTLALTADTDSAPCGSDLDNTVDAYWGCGAADGSSATKPGVDAPDDSLCLTATSVSVTDTPTRQPGLAYLNIAMSPLSIDACLDSTEITVVMENTGPTDASDIDLTITLPSGITYNAGTSESGLGTDQPSATAAIGAIGDPAIAGQVITYYDINDKANDLYDTLQADGGNDTIVLRFDVQTLCYSTQDMDFSLYYYDCCGDTRYETTGSFNLPSEFPDLSITKTANPVQVDCGNNVEFTIRVINNGTGNAEVVRVVDTLGDWLDYAGNFTETYPGPVTPALIGGDPQVVGWEFNNLGPGASATFTFEATLNPDGLPNQADCSDALRENNVEAVWACGTAGDSVDDDPNTTGYDCTNSVSASAAPVVMGMPNLVVTSITPDVNCNSDGNFSGSITVRVTNNGDGGTSGTFTVEVTDGKGWTGTGTHGAAIPAGGFVDVTINTATWNPDCQPCGAPYSFNATVDLNNDICECDETDNTTGSATTYTVPIPDLVVDSDSLSIVCNADGQATVTGGVTLMNNGCNTPITSDIPMRFTLYNDTGCAGGVVAQWTGTFTAVNILAGGTRAFAISDQVVTSNMCLDSTGCEVSIFVEADYNDSVCECDGTNNTYCADNIPVDIPDIEVASDTLTVTCLNDGQVTVSGNVTITNNGCGSNLNSNIPMRFTLYDNTGCAGNQLAQWTQTFAGVNIAAGGGNQGFAITPHNVGTNMVTHSTGCQVSIRVEADYSNSICECDGTDNTYCADNINVDIPDVEVTSDTLAISCVDDGEATISGSITLTNNGCGSNLNSNVPVRFTLYDNTGCAGNQVAQWTETFAGVNIAAGGGNQVFAITPQNVISDLCTNSTACQLSIRIEADHTDTICESDGTDNTRCSNKTINLPNLQINSVTPQATCVADGNLQGSVTVNAGNDGCGDASNVVVRLTSDCGHVFADQTVNLTAGGNTNVVFNFTPDCTNCTCIFTASVDPDGIICECDGTDNVINSAAFTMNVPDIEVQSETLGITCSDDGQVTVSGNVTLVNNGCGTNLNTDIPMRFTLYDNTGCAGNVVQQWTETFTGVNIASGGGNQVFTISNETIAADMCDNSNRCQFSIGIEADYNDSICECDGTNNTYCADNKNVDIPDIEVTGDALTVTCFDDGQVTVSGSIIVTNSGCGANLNTDIPVQITLFDNTGCAGNQLIQWSENLSGVNIPARGGTQIFAITPQNVGTDLVANSTDCQVSIRVEADYLDAICECDGTNNTYCADNIDIDVPDLEVTSSVFSTDCLFDGEFTVSGTVNLANNGCGSNLNSNVPVQFTLFAGVACTGTQVAQWNETFGGVNIPAEGGNQEFAITPQIVIADLAANSTGCRFSILVEADYTNTICESDGTDNTFCANGLLANIPDLQVNSVIPVVTCLSDGNLDGQVTVNISNEGCANVNDTTVSLGCDCPITFANQSVNLPAGSNTDLIFSYTPDCANCDCTFVATIDPGTAICESDGANNTIVLPHSMNVPNIEVQSDSLVVACLNGRATISGTMVLVNNGCGPDFNQDIPMRFFLYDGRGCVPAKEHSWVETLNLVNIPSGGGTQVFAITTHELSAVSCDSDLANRGFLQIEVDYEDTFCSCEESILTMPECERGAHGPTVGGKVMRVNKTAILTQWLRLPLRAMLGFGL